MRRRTAEPTWRGNCVTIITKSLTAVRVTLLGVICVEEEEVNGENGGELYGLVRRLGVTWRRRATT